MITITVIIIINIKLKKYYLIIKNEKHTIKNTTTKNNFNDPIKSKNRLYKLQNMHIYCKNCEKHTGNTFPKKN